jgi:hypothetical protein
MVIVDAYVGLKDLLSRHPGILQREFGNVLGYLTQGTT